MAQQNLRARQQQRQRFIIILVILALVGAGAFFFLNGNGPVKKAVKPRPKGHVAIPIAKKNIPLGTRISRKEFTVKFMKPNDVPTDAILSVDEFLGRYSSRPILEGQYFKQSDVGQEGAVGGFSAMAKPGKRIISLPANLFPGSLETLRVGDKIDLLAFEGTSVGLSAGRKGKSLASSGTTIQGGGSQPGDPNSKARQLARAARTNVNAANATNATLIAENAEVMSVPPIKKKRKKGGGDYLVLQMTPQDAHVTTLMAATSTVMRTVFRPYGDETRLTQDNPVGITTRFPRAVADPEAIMIISGGSTYMQRPNSKLFVNESDRQNNAVDEDVQMGAPSASTNNQSKTGQASHKDIQLVSKEEVQEENPTTTDTDQTTKAKRRAVAVSDEANAEEADDSIVF